MVKAIKITLLCLLIMALVMFMIGLIQNKFDLKKMKPKLVYSESFVQKDINDIKVSVKSSDVTIFESENDEIKVDVYANDKDKVNVENNNGTLSITINKKSNICFGICFGSKIKIYVPKDFEADFDINASSGDITSNINTFNNYKIKVSSGDIELKNVNSLTGKATSGDLEIKNIKSYISFTTTSGDIDIDNLELTKNSDIKVTSGDVSIDQVKDVYVSGSAKSGDVDIKGVDRHAKYELKIKTTSGDIEVN